VRGRQQATLSIADCEFIDDWLIVALRIDDWRSALKSAIRNRN
jgi:hypothetical protein